MPKHKWLEKKKLSEGSRLLGVAVLYLLLGQLVHRTLLRDDLLSLVWPSSGVALAALLAGGRRYFWAVLLGSLGLGALALDSAWVVGSITLANVLEALVGYGLLTARGRAVFSLRTLSDFLRLIILGGGLACLAGALVAAGALLLTGAIAPENFMQYLMHRWMGHTIGIVLVASLILTWLPSSHAPFPALFKCRLECWLLFGAAFLIGQVVFLDWFSGSAVGLVARGYWMFLPVAWIAIRVGPRGVTLALLMIATQALVGAYRGAGFFSDDIVKTGLQNYWFFMLILSVVGMSLATYVKDMEQTLAALQVKDNALSATVNGVVITDAKGLIEWVNPAFSQLTGYSMEEAVGRNPSELVKSGKHDKSFYRDMWKSIRAHRGWRGEIINRRKDGSLYDEEMTITSVTDQQGAVSHFVAIKQNVTERKRLEKEVQQLAFFDPLTHLPNRRLLADRLARTIAECKRSGDHAALMVLDLDNFKSLNDTYGHTLGDALLVEVASRLKNCVREVDTVARFGGDEFVVLLKKLEADKATSSAQAAIVAEKIRTSLAQPYLLKTPESDESPVRHQCTSSIGVVVFGDHEVSAEDVFKWADASMYVAKEAGRNSVRFFDSAA